MKKIMEFVYQPVSSTKYAPHILAIDVEDISSYEQHNKNFCKLNTKLNKEFYIFGTYRVIGNRVAHTETKNQKIYDDVIIRPSISLIYKKNTLEISDVIMDASQLKAFIDAFYYQNNLEEIYNELLDHTYENIKSVPNNFWDINLI